MEETKKKETPLEVTERPVASIMPRARTIDMIEDQEEGFQKVVKIALGATSSHDWIDDNGKPFLVESGAQKIALRLGMDLTLDRNDKQEPIILREDFTDELGPYYVYTACGRAALPNGQVIDGIGTASTRDNISWKSKRDQELHPVWKIVQDAKKKSVTSLWGTVIKKRIGIAGWSWEMLSKYGITPEGEMRIERKQNPEMERKQDVPELPKPDEPEYGDWTTEDKKHLIFAWADRGHFTEDFLKGLGLKAGRKNRKKYWGEYSDEVMSALNDAYRGQK